MNTSKQETLFFTRSGVKTGYPGRWRQPSFLGGVSHKEANKLLRAASPKWHEPPSEVTDPYGEFLTAALSGKQVREKYINILRMRGVRRETITAVKSLMNI